MNVTNKVYEQLIVSRIKRGLDANPLSDRQYGFRQGRSIIAAINRVVETAKKEVSKGKTRGLYALVIVDIKNAFNSVPWEVIHEAMGERQMLQYIREITEDYLDQRSVRYEEASYVMTGGVLQGSVLGPILWNIAYDNMLKLWVPAGVTLIAFAYDLAVDRTEEGLIYKVNHTQVLVDEWITRKGIEESKE